MVRGKNGKHYINHLASSAVFAKLSESQPFKILTITLVVCFLSFFTASCQNYNYIQFTTKDGLPGMTVYDICQDKDGFIWCATDNGLARFDGRTFKTFTIEDGLPDNDVLTIYNDTKGRIWIGTFKNEISYYYKGQIYNRFNDTILAKISIQKSVNHFHETGFGSIMISDLDSYYEITSNGLVNLIYSKSEVSGPNVGSLGYDWLNGKFGYTIGDSLFEYNGADKKFAGKIDFSGLRKFVYGRLNSSIDTPKLEIPYTPIRITLISGMPRYVSTVSGSYIVDTINLKFNNLFLSGKTVSNTFSDNEGNLWFSTVGFGLYKLSAYSESINKVYSSLNYQKPIYCIHENSQGVYLGLDNSKLAFYSVSGKSREIDYKKFLDKGLLNTSTNRLNSILSLPDKSLLLGFDAFLLKENFSDQICLRLTSIKNLFLASHGKLIVTSGNGVYLVDTKDFKITDTLYSRRALDALEFGQYYYFATLSGLRRKSKIDGKEEDISSIHPALTRRINDLYIFDNKLWISTADKGLVCLKRDTLYLHLTQDKGLSSNNCKKVFGNGNELWIATNKGVTKIDVTNPYENIIIFDQSDLLRSDLVNDVLVNYNEVWIATNNGLTYFNKADVNPKPYCNIAIESINEVYYDIKGNNGIVLDYNNSSLIVEFLALSFRSSGRIKYYYQLKGRDSVVIESSSNFVSYKEIPSGKYEFLVFAVNKFGVKSNVITIPVTVKQPFWKSWWFIFLAIIFSIFLILAFLLLQQQYYRNRLEERNLLHKHLFNVEQYALQLQLNPHFIFNCLNSIQQFILKNNAEDANRFLAGFSVLIREALNNSTSRFISLSREIRFLERYLKLEQSRFNNKFSFSITVDSNLDPELDVVPVMLLQPYLENAIKHGLSNNITIDGMIELKFVNRGGILWCIIQDNGIGISVSRKKQSDYRRRSDVSAMRILKRRVEVLNETGNYNYMLKIIDLSDESDNLSGTRVEIKLHRVYGA
ncbi:MAG: histidine kinase [Chitinophagaceae bacterium]|nr:histidine kinase [Chitinophagaceae bacterium]